MNGSRCVKAVGLMVLALLVVPLFPSRAWGAPGAHLWAKAYGGSGDDFAFSVTQTSDGGLVVAGSTNSFGAGGSDGWILHLDPSGGILWQKAYGGPNDDLIADIQPTSDGGFVAAGCTDATSRFPGSCVDSGTSRAWLLKLDSSGTLQWQRAYGGPSGSLALSVHQTSDGNYVLSGFMQVGFPEVAFILKVNSQGDPIWQRSFPEFGCCIVPMQLTSDGGLIIAGFGFEGVMVLRLDIDGNAMWAKTYTGLGFSAAFSIEQTSDSGYVVAGITNGFVGQSGLIVGDFWVIRLDNSGSIVWQKAYGGTQADYAISVKQTFDRGFIIAGWTNSFGTGGMQAWVLRLGATGDVVWQKAYGGLGSTIGSSIQLSSQGGFVVAGQTNSTGAGGTDAIVLKMNAHGAVGPRCGFVTPTRANVTDTSASVGTITPTTTSVLLASAPITSTVTSTSASASAICGTGPIP